MDAKAQKSGGEFRKRFSPRLHPDSPIASPSPAPDTRRFSPRLHPNNSLHPSSTFPNSPTPPSSDFRRRTSPRRPTPATVALKDVCAGLSVSPGTNPHLFLDLATDFERRLSPRLHPITPSKHHEDASKESVLQRRLSPRLHPHKAKDDLNPLFKTCTVGKRLRDDSHATTANSANRIKLHHPEVQRKSPYLHSNATAHGSNALPLQSTGRLQMSNKIVQTNGSVLHAAARYSRARVKEALRTYNTYYLQLVQEEERRKQQEIAKKGKGETSKSKELKKGKVKSKKGHKGKKGQTEQDEEGDQKRTSFRPDLKAVKMMVDNKETLNSEMMVGPVPGIGVGDEFCSRAEMVAVGLHYHWMHGIGYIGESRSEKKKYKDYTLPFAVSVVMSGQYEDDLDNSEDIMYTGEGGHDLVGNKQQKEDQSFIRGNLALKNSMDHSVPIRVIRGRDNRSSYTGTMYSYDGLYKVVETLASKGRRGHLVYRFRLKRLEGQPKLRTVQVKFVRKCLPKTPSKLLGLISHDITNGQEDYSIPVTNIHDVPPLAPAGFTYIKSMEVSESVKLPPNATGCTCKGNCTNPLTCACAKLNGSDFPYVRHGGGRLFEPKDIVFECGPNCGCGPGCLNRTSQRGMKYQFEIYRTPNKGWGVRSWDFIPSGAPVCEYIGVLRRSDELDNVVENDFLFYIDCMHTMNEIEGRERRFGSLPSAATNILPKIDEKTLDDTPEFSIDAGSRGNITRFINHSCEPNLFVQCILSSHHDLRFARLVLFASEDISPKKELTYDYGYALDSVVGPDGKVKTMPCFCGTAECRKRLY